MHTVDTQKQNVLNLSASVSPALFFGNAVGAVIAPANKKHNMSSYLNNSQILPSSYLPLLL